MSRMTLEQVGVEVLHHFTAGVYAKQARIPAGITLTQHVHVHDHMSVLAQGQVFVEVDGHRQSYIAPHCLTIKAGKVHSIHAVTEAVWLCIHATDDTDPETVDQTILKG